MADIREVLSEKFDAMQTEAPAEAPTTPTDTAPAAEVVTEAPAVEAAPEPTGERVRDESGKFIKKSSTAATPAAKPGTPATAIEDQGAAAAPPTSPAAAPASPETPKFKAPQSWRPEVREKWASLPVEVQQEADRLDKEYQKILRDTAQARQMTNTVRETLAPFEGLARANGMDSLKYAGSVMQTAAALHMGTPQQKAAIVAQLISTYGIDVDGVNAVMQGQAPAQTQQAMSPEQVQEMARRAYQEERQKTQMQELTSVAQQALNKTKPGCEFWDDIGEQKIIELGAFFVERDPSLAPDVALKNAYDILADKNSQIAGVLKQRRDAEAAKARIASTQQAKTAAGSIRTQPAASGEAKVAGRRAVLEHAASKLGIG